jgi:phage terminase large subunit
MTSRVRLPQLKYRDYQMPAIEALKTGCKRLACLWHRRAGKDLTFLNVMVARSAARRKGLYAMTYPFLNQGRKILWEGMDNEGKRFLDYIPPECISKKNESEMRIEFPWGSSFQIFGADNIDALRGGNPVFVGFSEYAYMHPSTWKVMSPVLQANDGIAAFLSTSNGKNHFHALCQYAETHQPDWFFQKLTIEDTKKEDGTPIVSQDKLDEERAMGVSEEWINQEYYCSFEGALDGSFYGRLLAGMEESRRITDVPYDASTQVIVSSDLGIGDSSAWWFWQVVGPSYHLIDYYENSGEGVAHYAKMMRDKPYPIGEIYLPHDAGSREKGSGKSFEEQLREHGFSSITVVPRVESIETGISVVRATLPKCYIDKDKCNRGLECLRNYQRKYNRTMQIFLDEPLHNEFSNGADGFRTFCEGYVTPIINSGKPIRSKMSIY